jgi:putative membrane protein insertion efficiency factor
VPSLLRRLVGAFEWAVAGLLLGLVALYRALVSPILVGLFGARCRFHPSCSVYAAESIRALGPLRGSLRALVRLGKCHPFHPGGVDLPPARGTK